MSAQAAYTAAQGEPIRAVKPVSGSNPRHIPRRWTRDAIRVCLDLGYTVSGAEAWRLLKEWRDWREDDTRRFIASEFRTYVQRRGDLMVIRSKRYHEWRTRT